MAFMHVVLCFGIFVGVISNTDKLAAIYFMLLLWVQVLFILSPKDNLFVGLLSCGIFSVLSFLLKEPSLYIGDILNCFVAFIISQASNWILGRQRIQKIIAQNELHGLNEKLYWNSTHDTLTQLYNRRKFFEESIGYLDQDSNATDHLLVAIMDVDFFKAYNDTFGHARGDLTLIQLSSLLKEYFSQKDALLCRWGGEEFMYVMPLKSDETPLHVAESVLEYIRSQKLPTANTSISDYLTISMGGWLHKPRRKPKGLTHATTEIQEQENLLKQDFSSPQPLKKLLTDISQIQCLDGKLYISPILDCFNGEILSLIMRDNMKKELCLDTLKAVTHRYKLDGTILHSDYAEENTMPKIL